MSKLEEDFLGDLVRDSHELWELYGFVRLHHPNFLADEILRCGRELLTGWLEQGWLKVSKSRTDRSPLSATRFLAAIDKLGLNVMDADKGVFLLQLTERASKDMPRFSLGPKKDS
ncbi:MAG TPA: hypothetical protein VEU95_13355 [Micropepsaceae bacterium]|nr:hypothetical protein [Micropepsaceae bacterium]